jgi:hypothetical protein
MNDVELAMLCVAAFLGMLTNATLGYLSRDKGEKFKAGKFLSSVLRGVVTVIGVALTFPTVFPSAPIGLLQYFTAFLVGAGVDTVGHSVSTATKIADKLP